jgi:hypothetical protein
VSGKRSAAAGHRSRRGAKRTRARMWRCPDCRRRFANKNQSHFCSNVTLDSHFHGKPPQTRRLFDAFAAEVKKHGPVIILPEKTRIAFQVRMSFAALMTRRGYLRGHLVLAQRHEDPCFTKIETFSPRNHVHAFELRHESQLRGALSKFIGPAYRVGCQDHLD